MIDKVTHYISVLRLYTALYIPLLGFTSWLILSERELGGKQLLALDELLGVSFLVAAFLKLIAVISDRDEAYRFAYFITTIVLAWWTFTTAVYAAYGIGPFGRAVVYGYVLLQNALILPHLIEERRANRVINDTADQARNGNHQ